MPEDDRPNLPYIERENGLKYTDPTRVEGVVVEESAPPHAPGYGDKIPTRYKVDYVGNRWVRRRHRVYAMQQGNGASLYILTRGEIAFLDVETESKLEKEAANVLER